MTHLSGSRILCAALLAGGLVACQEPAGQPVLPEEAPLRDARFLGEFIGTYNAETGALTFEPASAIGTQQQNLDDVKVVQDGNTGTGPDDTVELVTPAATVRLTDTGCGGPALEATVTLRSFFPGNLGKVYMQILSISGGAFELCNSDSLAGVSNQFGLVYYGDGLLNGKGAAQDRLWKFKRPATTNFTFKARVLSSWCGQSTCIGWCNTWQGATTAQAGSAQNFYGQLFVWDRTQSDSCASGVTAEFGMGPKGSDPRKGGWTWSAGELNPGYSCGGHTNDEYRIAKTMPAAGDYSYGWRFKLSNVTNAAYVYCDDSGGAGWNDGVFFEPEKLYSITVTP